MTAPRDPNPACLACGRLLPGQGGLYRRVEEHGWAKSKHTPWGLLIRCPDCRRGRTVHFLSRAAVAGIDECIEWPFDTTYNNYGRVRHAGRMRLATHVVLELSGSPRPSRRAIALHSCDNPPCVNPRHLRWGTHKENAADRDRRGRHVALRGPDSPTSRLTAGQVREIRQRWRDGESFTSIAHDFPVNRQTVGRVAKRLSYKDVS